jgi:hypothetical protein
MSVAREIEEAYDYPQVVVKRRSVEIHRGGRVYTLTVRNKPQFTSPQRIDGVLTKVKDVPGYRLMTSEEAKMLGSALFSTAGDLALVHDIGEDTNQKSEPGKSNPASTATEETP